MYAVQCRVYEIYKNNLHKGKHIMIVIDSKKIPAIKYVNFRHCNLPVGIDDDENNDIEEI